MEPISVPSPIIKKQEDDDKLDKRDIKPVPKTLNRVPRACNACRKQKMRCEGADNPPCKRCRNNGLDCLFEKPSREATLTGEAGLERMRNLENNVADLQQTASKLEVMMVEVIHFCRTHSSMPVYPRPLTEPSPSVNSPSVSTPTVSNLHASPASVASFPIGHTPVPNAAVPRQHRPPHPNAVPGSSAQHLTPPEEMQISSPYANYSSTSQSYNIHDQSDPSSLPVSNMGPPLSQQNNVSSMRYESNKLGSKRNAPTPNVTSADSSDLDDDDGGELPVSGLVAPWEVLRGLADVAIERAAKENGGDSGSLSRTRTPSPERRARNRKRRKIEKTIPPPMSYPDVVTKGVISEAEARELFRIYYDGCSTFLPVFDAAVDTFDALHEHSSFAVNAICLVAARVRDGGGKMTEVHRRCLEEVQNISSKTLFAPVARIDAVQSMILVSGWSDNGWLSGGHAVRMALELSMQKAWPRLLKRMNISKAANPADRELVVAARTWFCLYLFEHQLSYGTGRPAVLKDDESIRDCRFLLKHPYAIEDDRRLVSTVELIAIRERVHNALIPLEGPVRPEHFEALKGADFEFKNWYSYWDGEFSGKYEDAAFYRQSLQIQHLHAELFHNATALRNIISPEDVLTMLPEQEALAHRSIKIARQGLSITVDSPAYRKGMTYAVHYTHATATFAASFLLRLARLFPTECELGEVREQVEHLAKLMAGIPGKRYGLTLELMLKRSRRRKTNSTSLSPTVPREPHQPMLMPVDPPSVEPIIPVSVPHQHHPHPQEQFSPTYPQVNYHMSVPQMHPSHMQMNQMHQQYVHFPQHTYVEAEHILRGIEQTNGDIPTWISDRGLGGQSFTQHGMDAFIMPPDYVSAPTW